MLPIADENQGYDFQDPENAEKWRGIFVNSLRKVLEQVHPNLQAEESGLQYVESLCMRLLATLCRPPSPLTVQDVEERVARTFPTPIDKWALADARDAAHRRRRAALPHDKVHQLLKEVLPYKMDQSVSTFITAILEYISCDILKLAGNFVKKIPQKSGLDQITCQDIETAMCADKVLMDMFYQDGGVTSSSAVTSSAPERRGSLTYSDLVRDLLTDEKHFLRDLNLIIRVFRDELEKILDKDHEAISQIFGNIDDIYELTVNLLGNLEDAMEMAQGAPHPSIGTCFEELAETEEFRAFVRYANTVTHASHGATLQALVDEPQYAERLDTAGHGFRLAVKYYLPALLLAPVHHVLLHHGYVLSLLHIAPHTDDRESLKQVECNLHPIKKICQKALANAPKVEATLIAAPRHRRQLAIEKCAELSRLIDNWEARDAGQQACEFYREDTLSKIGPGKKVAERRAYLFDGLLLLCKPVSSLVTVNSSAMSLVTGGGGGGGATQLKLKEKLHVRKIDVIDRPDTDDVPHSLELVARCGTAVVLACSSCADKRAWMCTLTMLNTKPMLERALDSILLDLSRKHPLRLPPVELYRFAVPDSPQNIVLEHSSGQAAPIVKGATLLKLVERLTYHIYADLKLVRTFLTTYRSFCSPRELLDLLVERFRIPDPSVVYAHAPAEGEPDKVNKSSVREDWKRYRKEFMQPVQFRVINVLRHWTDQHFYDFERDAELLRSLREFLESVEDRQMRKWVNSVLKTLHRKSVCGAAEAWPQVAGAAAPPAPHPAPPARHDWHPLALHPHELARQLTLLQFTLYRQVKPSELVGAVWTKKDKEKTSPNLLTIIKHTTNFTRWMEKWILESENMEERVGVCARLLETGLALDELNNFNGVLCVVAAFGSAAVHRLKLTLAMLPVRLTRALAEFRQLNSCHFRRYQARLRSINPPCVPFLGMYLTNILHIEEGNLDYLPNSELINFSKRRKVAEITGEIQQYQNQPYCIAVEPETRAFLESLDPFPGMEDNDITNYLYAKSLEIEPRQPTKQPPKFARRYPELPLKPLKSWRRHDKEKHEQHNDDTHSVSQMSPTGSQWDGVSVASLNISDSKGAGGWSPREKSSQFSLFDKTTTKNSSVKEEPASPRDKHSPRHERLGSVERKEKPPALSPRQPIVDSSVFYSRDRVPPLLPRNSAAASTVGSSAAGTVSNNAAGTVGNNVAGTVSHTNNVEEEPPPDLPPRAPETSAASSTRCNSPGGTGGAGGTGGTEGVPPPSPRHPPPVQSVISTLSPRRSPAPPPPASPAASPTASPAAASESDVMAFSFPSRSPSAAPPPPPLSAGAPSSIPPPPLPPRRRRDSIVAPPTPHNPPPQIPPSSASPPGWGGAGGSVAAPPPLPPRPAAAPALLATSSSAILQRRHRHTNSTSAPKLPPKPPSPAVAPRT